MKFYRIPTKQEEQLIELLVHKSSLEMSEDWKNGLLVRPMDDGEMGSLYLFPQGKINESRKLGRQISEFQFTDIDGVEVIASLNVDVDGVQIELHQHPHLRMLMEFYLNLIYGKLILKNL